MNRKLIRPNINEVKDRDKGKNFSKNKKKLMPQDTTRAEVFYYLKQMNNKTPMVVVLKDGEILKGFIEWYDKNCIKLNRVDQANLVIFKHNIKYIYKDSMRLE